MLVYLSLSMRDKLWTKSLKKLLCLVCCASWMQVPYEDNKMYPPPQTLSSRSSLWTPSQLSCFRETTFPHFAANIPQNLDLETARDAGNLISRQNVFSGALSLLLRSWSSLFCGMHRIRRGVLAENTPGSSSADRCGNAPARWVMGKMARKAQKLPPFLKSSWRLRTS